MNWLLDTNACIGAMRGAGDPIAPRFDAAVEAGDEIVISSLVLHELWFGIAKSARREANERTLRHFLDRPVATIAFDDEDARVAGDIRADLARAGTPIGPYDLLIAAQAKRRGLTLVTANSREFARIPGLAWQDWAKPPRAGKPGT